MTTRTGAPRKLAAVLEWVLAIVGVVVAAQLRGDPVAVTGVRLGIGAACVCAVACGVWLWRTSSARRRRKVDVIDLVLPIIMILGLVIVQGTAGIAIGGVAFGAYMVIVAVRVTRWTRVLRRVRARLVDARDWREPASGPDDGDETITMGSWNGVIVWVRADSDALWMRVAPERWPADGVISNDGDGTGDDVFDAVLRFRGDETQRRALLTSDIRERLAGIFRDSEAEFQAKQLEVVVRDERMVDQMLDRLADLANALPELDGDLMQRIFDNTTREPNAHVRADNYRWLVERDWNVLRVYRAASTDADPAISAWANEHAPDGVFR